MDMTGYLGKKVDITCTDGEVYSGYVTDVADADDSDIGVDSVELGLTGEAAAMDIPVSEIADVRTDPSYVELDFEMQKRVNHGKG